MGPTPDRGDTSSTTTDARLKIVSIRFPSPLMTALTAVALIASACSGSADDGSEVTTTDPETTESAGDSEEDQDDNETTTTTDEPVTGSGDVATGTIDWSTCGGIECGSLTVPLDHDDPDGPTIELAVTRTPASDPDPLGSIFLNFGGPSAETGEIMAFAGPAFAELLDGRFHVVGWDPRATGDTERLDCEAFADDDIGVGLVQPDDGLDDEIAVEEASFQRLAECASGSGPIVDHLATVDVARDLDLLRAAVGDEGLTYLGYSYGTQIGWVYASLFPENVRALVLDGAVPPGSFSSDGLIEQYAGFERTFGEFVSWCDDQPTCQAADEGLDTKVDRLVAELDAAPLELGDGQTFGSAELLEAVLTTLYLDIEGASSLDLWLSEVDEGAASGFVGFLDFNSDSTTPGVYKAVNCADGYDVDSAEDSTAFMTDLLAAAPRFGQVNEGIRCDLWPGEIKGLPDLDTTGASTILVVGNTLDPATPYESAVELDELLADSVLLTYEGTGHTIVGSDACIDGHVRSYVIDLEPPAEGTTCP